LESKGRFEEQADDKLGQKSKALAEKQLGGEGPRGSGAFTLYYPDQQKNVSTCRTSTEEPIPAKVRIPE
jgi:hypothetical protein